jgi:hypothetical protein
VQSVILPLAAETGPIKRHRVGHAFVYGLRPRWRAVLAGRELAVVFQNSTYQIRDRGEARPTRRGGLTRYHLFTSNRSGRWRQLRYSKRTDALFEFLDDAGPELFQMWRFFALKNAKQEQG